MTSFRRAGARIALIVAVVAAAFFVAGQPASAAWKSCDLGVKVDELRALDPNGNYNVLVWKNSAEGSVHLEGVVNRGTEWHDPCNEVGSSPDPYHYAMFKSGDFVRKGDGGYRNWAFFGNWKRPTDNHVIFKPR